jgi:lysophospholipid acyltransferase
MDAIFQPLADTLGASVDQIKVRENLLAKRRRRLTKTQLISCLLLSYPLGSVFVRIPSSQPTLRHLFNIGVTLFYLLPMLGLYGGTLQLLGSTLATYFIAKTNTSASMPWIVFALVFASHLSRSIQLIYGSVL